MFIVNGFVSVSFFRIPGVQLHITHQTLSELFHYSLFIEEVKRLGLFCWELGKGAAPLHKAARGVICHVGLRFRLLYSRRTRGRAEQSAEAVGGKGTESQRGHKADRSAGKKQGMGSPTD